MGKVFRRAVDAKGQRLFIFGDRLPNQESPEPFGPDKPDWLQAHPRKIGEALERMSARPTGGWYVLDASRQIGKEPRVFWVDGEELVAWRDGSELRVAPNSCPHMGAPLSEGGCREGRLRCPWHGLELKGAPHGRWEPLVAHDDGLLSWVRLAEKGQDALEEPVIAPRPVNTEVSGVIRVVANCEARDVIANRLDPWHGAHFHPHSFARLRILQVEDDVITVRVAYRVVGPLAVEVDATFDCPDGRTIVMTIVGGEGEGSVVETHATPLGPGWTAIVEATVANAHREGFGYARRVANFMRPFIEARARRLWVEDAAYGERTYLARLGARAHRHWYGLPYTEASGARRPR